jgi:hypothetical protein
VSPTAWSDAHFRAAAKDGTWAVYLGERESGALNMSGIAQVARRKWQCQYRRKDRKGRVVSSEVTSDSRHIPFLQAPSFLYYICFMLYYTIYCGQQAKHKKKQARASANGNQPGTVSHANAHVRCLHPACHLSNLVLKVPQYLRYLSTVSGVPRMAILW